MWPERGLNHSGEKPKSQLSYPLGYEGGGGGGEGGFIYIYINNKK